MGIPLFIRKEDIISVNQVQVVTTLIYFAVLYKFIFISFAFVHYILLLTSSKALRFAKFIPKFTFVKYFK